MSPSTSRNFIIASIVLLIAAAGFAYMFREINVQGSRLVEYDAVLEKQQAQEQSYFRLQKIYEESSSERNVLAGYFLLEEGNSISVLNEIETKANNLQVDVQIEGLQTVTEGDIRWIQIDINFSGTEAAAQDYIKVIENLPYVSYISALSVSADVSGGWQADATIMVRLLSYDS
jgi:hypothetical protein